MARDAESVHTFTREQKFRLNKEITVVRCDDGAVYEFEKALDEPDSLEPRLRKVIQPNGNRTHTGARKILPSAVEETVNTVLGGWSK